MDFETRAIHAGQEPDPATGAVTTPIYQTSTFAQEAVGVHKGYDYARVANPTRTALEECLASLENAAHGHAFSSGLGATTSIMHLLDPGDHVVCVNDVYGGTYRMFSQVYEPKGYRFTYATPERALDQPRGTRRRRQARLARDTDQPAAQPRRHRRRRGCDPRRRRPARRRLDVRDALPPEPARPRCRHRRPLDDEVPRRALGRDRRLRRDERSDDRRAAAVPPEVPRGGAWAVRRVARAPRREDARGQDGSAVRERAPRRRVPLGSPARDEGALAGAARPPGARDRRAADARLRRHGLVPRARARRRPSSSSRRRRSGRWPRASAASRA